MRNDRFYVLHMNACISRIEEYTAGGRRAFTDFPLIQDAVLRNLQILAESSQRISQEIKIAHPEIEWRQLVAFRNILVHGYLGVDMDQVWEVLAQELPDLKQNLLGILESLEDTL